LDNLMRTTTTVEVYDPQRQTWMAGTPMLAPRADHRAIPLPDGRVLVTGGSSLASTEIYDPATGRWTAAGEMATPRSRHSLALLPDGRPIVIGGQAGTVLASAEIFSAETGGWTLTAPLPGARSGHAATILPDGRVLVVGGTDERSRPLTTTEIYDPSTHQWSGDAPMVTSHPRPTLTITETGTILLDGDGERPEEYRSATKNPAGGRGVPTVREVSAMTSGGTALVSGEHLSDDLERSGGGFQHSPVQAPTVTLVSLVFGRYAIVSAGGGWTANQISLTVPPGFPPGPALLTVWVGGSGVTSRLVDVRH
jgi:hypothetical protein